MADFSLDDFAALLDEKLRPIRAQLDEHSRQLQHRPEERELRLGRPLAIASIVLVVLAVVLGGRLMLGRLDGGATGTAPASGGKTLFVDDFSTPARGLFLDKQRGTALLPGDRVTAQWDYAYENGELVAHAAPPGSSLAGRVIGGSAKALNRVSGDFAFEVRARASRAAASAVYGLRLYPADREFGFGVGPARKSYQLWEIFRPPLLSGSNAAIASEDGENVLRLEARGSAIRLFDNGQLLEGLRDDAFGSRPASVGVFFDTMADPGGDTVEVRYSDFRVYSLGAS